MVPNLRHERVSLDLIHMRLLPYLDGERDQDALLDIMIELAEDGILAVQDKKEQPVTDKAQIREILGKELAVTLKKIAQDALLIG